MSADEAATGPQAAGRLLLLIPTTSYKAHDFMEAARRLGVPVAVGSDKPQVLEAYSDGLTVTIDFADRCRGLAQIQDYAKRYPLLGIIGVEDLTALLAAEASAALALPHNSVAAVKATVSKERQRQLLSEAGLPVPEYRLIRLNDDLQALAEELAYPLVLKPLSLSASRGVIRADDPSSFLAAADRIAAILKREDGEVLVERFIPGREFALEGLLCDGRLHALSLFDKPDPLDGPFFEETLYITPARLDEVSRGQLLEVARRTAKALGLTEGPVHAEFRLNEEGVWPLEMAARTIGGLCSRSISLESDMSLEELVLRHALGRLPESFRCEEGASGVMMIPIERKGTLRRVDGLGAAQSIPGIEDLRITIPIGSEVVPLPEGNKYLGFIFAKGETADAVESALRKAHGVLSFDIS